MSDTPEPNNWRDFYRGALLDLDPVRALPQIDEAYAVVEHRVSQLTSAADTLEIRELNIALYFLSLLRKIARAEAKKPKSGLSDATVRRTN